MNYLLDASALMNLIGIHGIDLLDFIQNQKTITLAYYELGNILWKNNYRNILSKDETNQADKELNDILKKIDITPIELEDHSSILNLAIDNSITFYDATYLNSAQKQNLTLATDDKKLYSAAKNLGVSVKKSKEIDI